MSPLRYFSIATLAYYGLMFRHLHNFMPVFKYEMLDTKALWATEAAQNLIQRLHFRSLIPVAKQFYYYDLLFPLIYVPCLYYFYGYTLSMHGPNSPKNKPTARSGICLSPFLAGFFDLLENLAILSLLHFYDGKKVIRELAIFGGMMTLLKWNSFIALPIMLAFHELLWSPKDDELEFCEELDKINAKTTTTTKKKNKKD